MNLDNLYIIFNIAEMQFLITIQTTTLDTNKK